MSYADVNGVRLWHGCHGAGPPLVLLHGGIGSGEMFAPLLPAFTPHRRVITVDLQGHGRTPDVDRPLRHETLADDVAALLRHLGLPGADVLGYSLGGAVALRIAIQHPGLVRRLVCVSVPYRRDGWYPRVLTGMAAMGEATAVEARASPTYAHHTRVAPRPQDWPVLWTKLGALLRRDYDWSAEVAALTVPTLLVFADADAVRTAHMVEFFGLLGGGHRDAGPDGTDRPASRLAVLPGHTHHDIVGSPALSAVVLPFLTHPVRPPG
ncbi:alpha/beta fold hydrolase [Micromonospora sagamiensis]|uniref:Pimeloyl-ACP methyl ester carboxylesterase n=1 Tax=Micromonospora sagamiensis TaxID=47875 RepID=A0A562WCU1_9ACTN|nr:alpha/beta hydrolase [Micromonospora sagamiensis]TWJ27945.1 pimeloyl-ACP methyl ester carboxylesterase [Micromonospora sagamiensis]BCL13166.1 alpha/beta hydrolase [Micromonospora sagamiensis]